MSKRTSKKGKNKDKTLKTDNNNSSNFSPESSFSSSIFESINFSALFNPHDKYIHCGEKTSYDLMSYNLGIFNSLSTICKNLNMPYDKIYSNSKYSSLKKRKNTNGENNNENIINNSNEKDITIIDSIFKMLLSESDSGNKATNRSTKKNKKESRSQKKSNKSNKSDSLSLTEDDLNELLKDYVPMDVEK